VMHILHQLQVLEATTRMLVAPLQRLQLQIEGSESLFACAALGCRLARALTPLCSSDLGMNL